MELLTDIGLTLKIKTAIIADERLGSGTIDVDTHDGVVTLRGTVPNAAVRDVAEAVARLNGAPSVVNELRTTDSSPEPPETLVPESFPGVSTPEGAPVNPLPDLEEQVRCALEADPRINEHLVRISVDNGLVHLVGRQDTVEARDAVIEVASHVPGVLAVTDEVEVVPSV